MKRVSIAGCGYVADFKEEIKKKFPVLLYAYDTAQLALFEADGTSEIDPETLIKELFVTNEKPYVVKMEENPIQKPIISSSRHQDYKYSKAVHSSHSYLTSIAVELDKIYPISAQKYKGSEELPLGMLLMKRMK